MNFPPEVAKAVDIVERETGQKLSDTSIKIAAAAYQLSLSISSIGKQHAKRGQLPVQEYEIIALTVDLPDDLREKVTQLLYENYMIGYSSVMK